MNTVIGLGHTGGLIADLFSAYPQYVTYKVRDGKRKGKYKNIYTIPTQSSPELYDETCPSLKAFFKDIPDDILFVVDGSETVSAASLRVLEGIRNKSITVLYVRPDLDFLTGAQRLNERTVRGVLQEYARSAIFERIYLVDVPLVAATLGDVPIKSYHAMAHNAIVSTLHMINVFSHSPVIMGNVDTPSEMARVSTFGFVDAESGKENLFFPLDFPREKSYYFAINEDKLQTDGSLLKRVKEQALSQAHDKLRTSYAVYETKYEDDYIYVTSHGSMVQL
jgi:hypothetical protein|tara:strand:+ start:936 stop:1772 length:837 start_codon:yes stop_codon:yes gene_type:complete